MDAGLDIDLNSDAIQGLVRLATEKADRARQSFMMLHGSIAVERSFETNWEHASSAFDESVQSQSGREGLAGIVLNGVAIKHSLETELAKALLALWLYFDLECAASAKHVRFRPAHLLHACGRGSLVIGFSSLCNVFFISSQDEGTQIWHSNLSAANAMATKRK